MDEETALLSKHVENLANAGSNLQQQIKATETQLAAEELLVQKFRKELVATFCDVCLHLSFYYLILGFIHLCPFIINVGVTSYRAHFGLLQLQIPMMDGDAVSPTKGSERITVSSVDCYLSRLAGIVASGQHDRLKAKAAELIKSAIKFKTITLCTN